MSYDELLKQYRDLQLRVTQFSVVEQQLINTRDRLDHELVMYKRLNDFNGNAFRESGDCSFFRNVAEAIVDIFEMEVGLSYRSEISKGKEGFLAVEGVFLEQQEVVKISEEIDELSKSIDPNFVVHFSERDLSKFQFLNQYHEGIFYRHIDIDREENIVFVGLISKRNGPLYQPIGEKHVSFFNVFIHQVISVVSNRRKSERIREQLTRISNTKTELRKLSMIATKTKNGVVITDAFGRIEWVNDAFTQITGYEVSEVIGRKPKDFLQREGVDTEIQMRISEALKKGEGIEVTIRNFTKNGELYYNNLHLTPIFNEEQRLVNFIGIQRDISEEIRFKEELLRVNSKYELITTRANIGIWEWNATTNETYWNDVLIDHYGFGENKKFIDVWRHSVIQEDYAAVKSALINLYQGDSDQEDLEYRIARKFDGELRYLKSLSIAERDSNGVLQRLVGNVIDVTDMRRWQADVLRKNEELKKINAELDNFVYRVSHDLRSPLLAIKGIFSLIMGNERIDEETSEYITMAESSVDRLDGTIQEILEYSRNSRLEVNYEEFCIEELINEIYNDLRYSSGSNVVFEQHIVGTSLIYSDKARVKVLFKNILGNAFKYGKKNFDKSFVYFEMFTENDHIIFHVIDNGEGISEHSLGRVFDMFYRGTTSSIGTGLGLYICKEVLTNLEGNIEVKSKLGEGTTVVVTLPIIKKSN